MKYAPPKLDWTTPEEAARYQDVVSEWYAYQDELLGRLLAKIDLETTAVFVLSDHGFKSGERRIRSEELVDMRRRTSTTSRRGSSSPRGRGIRRGARSRTPRSSISRRRCSTTWASGREGHGRQGADGDLRAGFEAAHPLAYVASYESAKPEEKTAKPSEDYGKAQLAENMAGLEALGYVKKRSGRGRGGRADPRRRVRG